MASSECCRGTSESSPSCCQRDTAALVVPTEVPKEKKVKRVISRSRNIPKEILENPRLNSMIAELPSNYSFEIHKTIWRILEAKPKRVALQFPEGLLLFAPVIASIVTAFTGAECVLLGDVTYGACCVDDWAAKALGADFLVHYGHSCLVSIRECVVPNMMYVFVEIKMDIDHFIATVKQHISKDSKLAIGGTVQFSSCVRAAADALKEHFTRPPVVPQAKPLSMGEVLGCTSPKLPAAEFDTMIFLADGRFHLESMMIHNPHLRAYLYNPYTKLLTEERYDQQRMLELRRAAITDARRAKQWGVILGTLGHQGSRAVLGRVEKLLQSRGLEYTVVLLSEVFPAKLELFADVEAWVQISCPRLSIDWGYAFPTPLLTPFELEVALGAAVMPDVYPMDWYAREGGPWAVYTDKQAPLSSEQQ